MTTKEAIDWISGLYPEDVDMYSKTTQALNMAIIALENQALDNSLEEYKKAFSVILQAFRDEENSHKILERYLLENTCCCEADNPDGTK